METIAELAGVSVGTIYAHFGSKEGLALAYLESVFDVLEADLAPLRSEASPLQRVLTTGDIYLAHVIRYPAAARMVSVGSAYLARGQSGDGNGLAGRVRTLLLTVGEDLRAAMDAGEIARVPIDELLIFVWGAWHGVSCIVVRDDGLAVPKDVAERALQRGRSLLLASLVTGSPGVTSRR